MVARVISGNIQSIAIWLKGSVPVTALYETDLVAWAREQADLARRGSVNALDMGNIAEELEGMGRAERRALASQLERLMAHLLKWRYQPQPELAAVHPRQSAADRAPARRQSEPGQRGACADRIRMAAGGALGERRDRDQPPRFSGRLPVDGDGAARPGRLAGQPQLGVYIRSNGR